MTQVILTVRRADERRQRDIEVPAHLASPSLGRLIAGALGWDDHGVREYRIEVPAAGITLNSDESLADAGVWDGSYLILHPVGAAEDRGTRPRTAAADSASPTGEAFPWKRLED